MSEHDTIEQPPHTFAELKMKVRLFHDAVLCDSDIAAALLTWHRQTPGRTRMDCEPTLAHALMDVYRWHRANGQPVDPAAEAIAYGINDESIARERRARRTRPLEFTYYAGRERMPFHVRVPPHIYFAHLNTKMNEPLFLAGLTATNGDALLEALVFSNIDPDSLVHTMDAYTLLIAWYREARMAGEEPDLAMESIKMRDELTAIDERRSDPAAGRYFTTAIPPQEGELQIRVFPGVHFEHLKLTDKGTFNSDVLRQVLESSGIPSIYVPRQLADAIQAGQDGVLTPDLIPLILTWYVEALDAGEPVDHAAEKLFEGVERPVAGNLGMLLNVPDSMMDSMLEGTLSSTVDRFHLTGKPATQTIN